MSVDRLPETAGGPGREQLDFVGVARSRFRFLVDLAFEEVCAEPTFLRFERADSFVEVFHGRASYELGVEFGRWVDVGGEVVEQKFHIGDVLPVVVPEATFTARSATSREQVARFMEELASSAKLVAERLERAGLEAFDRFSEAVERQSDEYLDGVRAARLRARAEDGWHRKDFVSVIIAYEEIDSELDTVELRESEVKRLSYARKHLDA